MTRFRLALVVSLLACGTGCSGVPHSDSTPPTGGGSDAGPPATGSPDAGPGSPDAGPGSPDAGPPPLPTDINAPDNATRDTDCDGLSDAEEFARIYAGGGRTHPGLADSDGDGIPDGVEVGGTGSPSSACSAAPDADRATRTNPTLPDSDLDGCLDGEEDVNRDGRHDATETDPSRADADCLAATVVDTDGDGLSDLAEASYGSDPARADTDGDGLRDGLEDRNRNGRYDPGETHVLHVDSDCDGLPDGGTAGEDRDADGTVDPGETDPSEDDTDRDGLADGLELGVTTNLEPDRCRRFQPDADPASTTLPTQADSDGDGVSDGAEDTNKDGRVNGGELDPRTQDVDATSPVARACREGSLRQVRLAQELAPDLQLALPVSFTEVQPLRVLRGVESGEETVGLVGYDPTNQVAFLAYRLTYTAPAVAGTVPAEHGRVRAALEAVERLSGGGTALANETVQTFSTWDAPSPTSLNALQAFYDLESARDLKEQTNRLLGALLAQDGSSQVSPSSLLPGTAGEAGAFKLQVEVVRRSDRAVVVVLALANKARAAEKSGADGRMAFFHMKDTAGGSALAQFADSTTVQCEAFTPPPARADFLFVVDDSGSMAASQTALADAADAVAARLGNTSLDWRIGMVTTSYASSGWPNSGVVRAFTSNIHQVKAWLTKDSTCQGGQCSGLTPATPPTACTSDQQCWVGTSGDGRERPLESARAALNALHAASGLRPDARVVVVLLTDTRDQSEDRASAAVADYVDYFLDRGTTAGVTDNPLDQRITVHGILCDPAGEPCYADEDNTGPRHQDVIRQTGGVEGSIRDPASITTTINAIVDSVVATTGYRLSRPAIGASVKVALEQVLAPAECPRAGDLPRSQVDGFDVDGVTGTLTFYGACRPATGGTRGAVSYRAWRQDSPNPDASCGADCGGLCPSAYEVCSASTCDCSCKPADQVTCAPGQRYETGAGPCGCVCDPEALGCGPTYQVDPEACACVCRPDCGGQCGPGTTCDMSRCACVAPLG